MRKKLGEVDRIRTVVNSSADETSESKGGVEDAVGGVGQSDILKTSSSQVAYGREHADGSEAKRRKVVNGNSRGRD